MDFYNGFNQPRRSGIMAILISALFGAILGGILVAFIVLRFYGSEVPEALPDSMITPGSEQEDIPYTEQKLSDYQDTPVVRAARKVVPAVVGITNRARGYNMFYGEYVMQDRATGTGVIIASDGYIVTNYHVVEDADKLLVTLSDEEEVEAELIGADRATDLAVLKIEKEGLPAAGFGNSDNIVVGEVAIAIGNPLGLDFSQTVTVGYISAKAREIEIENQKFDFIQTDAAINAGNSGGALVNLKGEVIGINAAKISIPGVEGMGFAIPANTVKDITRQLIEKGRVIRPFLGITDGGSITEDLAQQLQLPVDHGVIVQFVMPDTAASRAGLQSGDIIIEFEGAKIDDIESLRSEIEKYRVGDSVEIVAVRNNEQMSFTATLGEKPEDTR